MEIKVGEYLGIRVQWVPHFWPILPEVGIFDEGATAQAMKREDARDNTLDDRPRRDLRQYPGVSNAG